jgi:very-short-patch-repair endonuclease
VARTLLDLAGERTARALERNVERAEHLDFLDLTAIDDLLSRCGGHRGRHQLADAVALYRRPGFFRSAYERKLREIIRRSGLSIPAFNLFVEGYELDAYWDTARFAVEVDAYSTHGSPAAFERDHARDERLRLAGIEIARFTTRQIDSEPNWVGKQLKARFLRRRLEIGLRPEP